LPNPWVSGSKLPRGPAAVLAALHLGEPRLEGLESLTAAEWQEALDFANRSQMTMPLYDRAAEALPEYLRERADRDRANNRERLRRTEELYRSVAARLAEAGIEFLALKGLAQCPEFIARAELRSQVDIDLFTPRESVVAAAESLRELGFQPLENMESFPTDHLPSLIRKTGWEFRGDYFDPEMPTAVEFHFRFWDPQVEKLEVPDVEEFWKRRVTRTIAGVAMGTLCRADALGYTCLHLLRHILRGSERPFHVYELACFLDSHAADTEFWDEWRTLHSPQFRRLEALAFRFAAEWFGCALHPLAQQEVERLPEAARAWFDEFGTSGANRRFSASKPELWLHLSLLDSRRDAASVIRRRLLPVQMPGPIDAVHIPAAEMNGARRALQKVRYASYVCSRVRHHAASLLPTMRCGAVLWWRGNALGSQFWTFLAAAVLYNFALFVFVLLYNLYLLDLGYREDFLGVVSSAGTVGCVLGTIPAAAMVRRFGSRNSLVGMIGAASVLSALRALVTARVALAALSFVNGLNFAVWAVLMAPTIAGAVEEKRRPTAFSVFFATMFSLGVVGGWAGGKLPQLLHGKQPALLVASGLVALAILPALRMRPAAAAPEGTRIYPRGPFLLRFLVPFAVWHLATGSFNPFFNAYFARLRYPVEKIGLIFSGSQMVQVVTVLLAPVIMRRAGLVGGIVWMMAATACGLGGLAAQPGAAAMLAYVAYMGFQWMSEPGLNTLLMNHVEERERGGASALSFLVAFSAQAAAAWGAGILLARFGYGTVLAGAAGLALVAAGLFQLLLGHRNSEGRVPAPVASSS
jgi:MFS family permease